jgi:serine/threonine protein kinase
MVANDLSVETSTMTRVTGTLRWQAPELLDPDADDSTCAISLASDVYAYACVCYEVVYITILNIRTISHCRTDVFGRHTFPRNEK